MKGRTSNEQFRKQLDQLVHTLQDEITGGQYEIGDYLPSEKLLAARFGLGNLSVRKGLELLVDEGLIEKIPRVGNRVKSVRSRKVTLKFACPAVTWRNIKLAQLLEQFHSQYPWITVEAIDLPIDIFSPAKSQPIDVIMLGDSQFAKLAEKGGVGQLEALSDRPDIHPKLKGQYMFDGQAYMQPVFFSPLILCYNKKHFREMGLAEPDGSWTWDDLIRAGEQLSTVEGRYGFSFHALDLNRWPLFLLQSGERFEWNGSQSVHLRGSGMLESVKLFRNILQNRKLFPLYLSEANVEIRQMFMEGKLSMTLASYMGLIDFSQHSELEYDIAPVPYINEPRTILISVGAGVASESQHKEEAQLLVDFFMSPQTQLFIRNHTTSIPSIRTLPDPAAGEVVAAHPPRYPLYREIMFSFRSHTDLNLPMEAFPKLLGQLKPYLANMINEDELCDRIANALSK